jgi:PrgI family protein
MATYKVLQDIEAEDKLVGPLTLRQCIYAAMAALGIWLSYISMNTAPFLIAAFLPFIATGIFFAFPWRKEQSTEVWALAKIRFMLKPRRRIWDQSGVKELVTITAPRKAAPARRRNLTETEVRNRLKALAETVDSRGWATKNVPLNMYLEAESQASDRLVAGTQLPSNVVLPDAVNGSDMFDDAANPVAQQFEAKMTAAANAHRQQLVQQVNNPDTIPQQPAGDWFSAGQSRLVPLPNNLTPEQEAALVEDIKHKQEEKHAQSAGNYGHMRVINPASAQTQIAQPVQAGAVPPTTQWTQEAIDSMPQVQPADTTGFTAQATQLMQSNLPPAQMAPAAPPAWQQAPVTLPPNPATMELANNNDLSVAAIAREARRLNGGSEEEVVVSLH